MLSPFKRLFLVVVLIFLFGTVGFAMDWREIITGECSSQYQKEVILKKGMRVKMMTQTKDGKIVVEETVLRNTKKGILLNCERGIFVLLPSCGNLIPISEKEKQKEKVVIIEREPLVIERYIYVEPPPPPPLFFLHIERHKNKIHFRGPAPVAPPVRPPTVLTRPPIVIPPFYK